MKMISLVAYNNDKTNKTRSILIMIAICLMTLLLTVVGTFGRAVIKMQKADAAINYGSNYGVFTSIDDNQFKELERHGEIGSLGIMRIEGILKGNERGTFAFVDQNTRKMFPSNQAFQLKEGAYPEKGNEIAAGEAFFQAQGYHNVKIGDTVTLNYRSGMDDRYHEQDFTIAGILFDQENNANDSSYVVLGSEDFYNSQFAEENRKANVYFTLNDKQNISMNNVEEVLLDLADSCKIDKESLELNSYYLVWILSPSSETVGVCAILVAGIILFSIVVIYNIFQVGIAQKIQEYGKIKALGATTKQMKQLIFKEGMFLALPSIPAGVVIGFLVAKLSFRWLIKQGNMVTTDIQNGEVPLFSVPILLGSIMISFVAVMIALRKPMKVVSKISPIEATRYLENATKRNQGKRKGKKNVTVFSMAMANITGNKKRTFGTILTMGLSCVLFVTISSYVGNMDSEYQARRTINHGQLELQLDYALNDNAYPENNLDTILKENPLNDELINKIKRIPEVTEVQTREMAVLELDGTQYSVSVVDKEDFEMMRWDSDIGNMSYEDAVTKGNVFFGWAKGMESEGYSLDEPVSFQLENGTGSFAYEGNVAGSFSIADTNWIMPEEVYRALQPEGNSYGYIWIDCDEKDVVSVQQSIEELIDGVTHVEMQTYHNVLQSARISTRMIRLGCYLFMGILGLIGFMNLANTVIINITTKKQEYGVLQAVGMTSYQLNHSLQIQGLIFSIGTIVVALVVGLPLGYMLFSYAKQNGFFGIDQYHIPISSIAAMILLVSGLQIILSCILSKNVKKETLVDRIRYQG